MQESDLAPHEDPRLIQAVERALAATEPMPNPARIRTLWAMVAQRAGVGSGMGRASSRYLRDKGRFQTHTLRQWMISGGVILMLGIGIILTGWQIKNEQIIRREASSVFQYATKNGQRATITLPDGGTVTLNVASQLQVPADYVAGNRTLRLVGEGLFEVTHHTGAPMVVIAGSDTARVLGTRFVVRRYPSDTTTTVAVQEGKVALRAVVLVTGQQVAGGRTGIGPIQAADVAQTSFVSGILPLNNVRLSDAVADLNRWYDVDIRLGDSTVAARRLTAGLPAGTLSNLAELLKLTFNVRVVRAGRVLTLWSR